MCLNLQTIRNPYYNKDSYSSEQGKLVKLPNHITPRNQEFIKVPCGKCSECRQRYINSLVQRGIIESYTSWCFFITLTYDNEHLPSEPVDGELIYYADYNHITEMFKRFRDSGLLGKRDFRYMVSNEYGDKKFRPHFHIMLFVARLEGDDEATGYDLEKIIKDNLGEYFSENVGTRKNPIYEKRFTYATFIDSKGDEHTNYFVKFVEPSDFLTYVTSEYIQDEGIIRGIQYMIGYINKPNRYDVKVNSIIDSYKDDTYLYDKYRRMFKSQVRYSKGFGCGFTNGKKFYMDKISVRCSTNTFYYTELLSSMPNTIEEFKETYEDLYYDLLDWHQKDFYKQYKSIKQALNHMTADDYILHCLYIKYFNDEFSKIYKRYKGDVESTISYHYEYINKNYKYSPQVVRTSKIEENPLYKYLREGVEAGIKAKVPFIAFKMVGQQRFTALCKYYKDRVSTIDDTIRMYEAIGVKNYSEWIERFNSYRDNTVGEKQSGNLHKYFNEDEVDSLKVKKFNKDDNKYERLFTNCK